ncbi:MAG: glycosyltransferase family 2 protein [Clostridia bacterium]|nr:glycosyltransferase family 2 protein [Clostridia bacterium]
MDKVSVIVPIYNTRIDYLKECLESLQSQSYPNIEILLVDDGSDKENHELYEKLVDKYKIAQLFYQNNLGVSAARNFGIEKATGKWVIFVDSDDWIEENMINTLCKNAKGVEVVISKFFVDNIPNEAGCKNEVILEENKQELINSLFGDRISQYAYTESACAKLYLKSFLEKEEIRFETEIPIGEDLLFNFDVYNKADKIKYIPIHTYHYRTNQQSVMKSYDEKLIQKYEKLFFAFEKKIKRQNMDYSWQYNHFIVRQLHRFFYQYICNTQFNVDNKEKERIVKKLTKKEPYKTAIKNVKLEKLSLRRILLIILLRLGCIKGAIWIYKK